MVGRKGLEPSQIALSVPKTDASTNSAIAPQILEFYILLKLFVQRHLLQIILIFPYNIRMIISPCISICKTDPSTGYCYGCGRNNEEKRIWKLENTTDEWKKKNLEIIKKRLSGWQLESFEESYTYKIENGISLFKKSLKNE